MLAVAVNLGHQPEKLTELDKSHPSFRGRDVSPSMNHSASLAFLHPEGILENGHIRFKGGAGDFK